jgi:hypothetical protein
MPSTTASASSPGTRPAAARMPSSSSSQSTVQNQPKRSSRRNACARSSLWRSDALNARHARPVPCIRERAAWSIGIPKRRPKRAFDCARRSGL